MRCNPESVWCALVGRYPAEEFNAARAELDPKNILAGPIVDALFPRRDVLEVEGRA